MKPASVVGVYTSKFSHSLFFFQGLGKLDVYWENVDYNKSRKLLS